MSEDPRAFHTNRQETEFAVAALVTNRPERYSEDVLVKIILKHPKDTELQRPGCVGGVGDDYGGARVGTGRLGCPRPPVDPPAADSCVRVQHISRNL